MGRDHAARTKRTGAALQGTGGITLPGTRLRISHIPLGSSASVVVRLLYCHVYRAAPESAFLPSLSLLCLLDYQICFLLSLSYGLAYRITKSAVFQVCRTARPAVLPGLPEA